MPVRTDSSFSSGRDAKSSGAITASSGASSAIPSCKMLREQTANTRYARPLPLLSNALLHGQNDIYSFDGGATAKDQPARVLRIWTHHPVGPGGGVGTVLPLANFLIEKILPYLPARMPEPVPAQYVASCKELMSSITTLESSLVSILGKDVKGTVFPQTRSRLEMELATKAERE
jgi:hypothetical protein